MRTYNLIYDPLYGSFAGDQGAWSTAKMCFTVPPNGVAKLHFGAHFPTVPLQEDPGALVAQQPQLRSLSGAALLLDTCSLLQSAQFFVRKRSSEKSEVSVDTPPWP